MSSGQIAIVCFVAFVLFLIIMVTIDKKSDQEDDKIVIYYSEDLSDFAVTLELKDGNVDRFLKSGTDILKVEKRKIE